MYKVSEIFRENKFRLFLNYCLENNITYVNELDGVSFEQLTEVEGIDQSKVSNIINKYNYFIEDIKIGQPIYSVENINRPKDNIELVRIAIERINEYVLETEIELLFCYSVSPREIYKAKKNGVKTIREFFEYVNHNNIDNRLRDKILKFLDKVSNPLELIITNLMSEIMDGKQVEIFINRAYGFTLQEVGDDAGITRERVRQISKKYEVKIAIVGLIIVRYLMDLNHSKAIKSDQIKAFVNNSDISMCLIHSLKKSKQILFLDFANTFVFYNEDMEILYEHIRTIEKEYIGEFTNFYEQLENIEEYLFDKKLDFIDSDDFLKYLLSKGYRLLGDYIIKRINSYTLPAIEMVKIHFTKGIRIYDNHEIDKLRDIISYNFPEIKLPQNNKAFYARIADNLILVDRGVYTHIENTFINKLLLNEIYQFIANNENQMLMYHEIYSAFQGKLRLLSSVANRHYLHGILKFYFPTSFVYERDSLKKGKDVHISIASRILDVVIHKGRSVHIDEIRKKIPGITNAIIFNAVLTEPKLITWEYNYYNHMDNIVISDYEIEKLNDILVEIFDQFSGYSSDFVLYQKAKEYFPDFLARNNIVNEMNLFYVAMNLFEEKYRFRRPHISRTDFTEDSIDMKQVVLNLIVREGSLIYDKFIRFGKRLGWSDPTMYNVFRKIQQLLVRISRDEYLIREEFNICEKSLSGIRDEVRKHVEFDGYCAFTNIIDYDDFPDIEYDWNGYLLESMLNIYNLGLKVIYPQNLDRRYLRGIIVKSDDEYKSYDQLVSIVLNEKLKIGVSETKFEYLLQMKGLANGMIPRELYDSEYVLFEKEKFYLKI